MLSQIHHFLENIFSAQHQRIWVSADAPGIFLDELMQVPVSDHRILDLDVPVFVMGFFEAQTFIFYHHLQENISSMILLFNLQSYNIDLVR
jgi:hypothetical protein